MSHCRYRFYFIKMKLFKIIPLCAQLSVFQSDPGIPWNAGHGNTAEGAEENQNLLYSGSSISNNSAFVRGLSLVRTK